MTEREIFTEALRRADPQQRATYLDEACRGESALRQQVESLLAEHQRLGSFLEDPPAALLDRPIAERPGMRIGPYKLLQQIGEGGMGVVFMAEQLEPIRRKVALKLIKPGMDSRQVIARFEVERQSLALMDHLNIARVLDAGASEAGRPYFVMELVHGVPITSYCDENRLTPRQRLQLFLPVCLAIQHAHQKGMIHRDIKPSNVMITQYDAQPVPKVIDFGVAKAIQQPLAEQSLFTHYGTLVGTLEYMSPEQAEFNAQGVDTRSDIYSLGVLLYELLTGSTPLDQKRMQETAYAEVLRLIREQEPLTPSTRLSESGVALATISAQRQTEPAKLSRMMRGELDWIVMKTLEKDRNRRYETVEALAADVQRYLSDEPVLASPPSSVYRMRKFVRRNQAAFTLVAAVAAAMLMTMGGLATSNVIIRAERNEKIQALSEKQRALTEKEAALLQAETNHIESKRQEQLAQLNAQHAKSQQQIAQQQETLARRRYYAAQMNLAKQAWDAGDPVRTLQLLESQRPRFDEDDLRSFDWYYLWRLCQGSYRFSLPTQNYDNATAIAISADGRTLASGFGHAVRLWDAATGRQTGELAGHTNLVGWLAFAPDGKSLASSDQSENLWIWDLATQKLKKTIQPGQIVKGVQFAGDSRTLALSGSQVKLWDVVADREVAGLESASQEFEAVAIAHDGSMVAASNASEVHVWTRQGAEWRELPPVTRGDYHAPVAISADGQLLATGWNSLRLFELPSLKPRPGLAGHTYSVHAVAFSADSKRLVSAGHDRSIRVWDVATSQQQECMANHGPVYGIALAPDSQIVAAMCSDAVRVWEVASPSPYSVMQHGSQIRAATFSPDGTILASFGNDGTTLWDVANGRQLLALGNASLTKGRIYGGDFSPDGKTLATTGTGEKNVEMWSISGERQAVIECDAVTRRMEFSPDGNSLGVACGDGTLEVWDTLSLRRRFKRSVCKDATDVVYSPDGQTIAVGGQFGIVKLFHAVDGAELNTLQRFTIAIDFANSLAFSPDGTKLAVATVQGMVRIWDLATNRLETVLNGHTASVTSVAFLENNTLATGSADRSIRLWDLTTGQERISLQVNDREVSDVTFSPDGSLLAAASLDKTVRIFHIATDAEATARKRELQQDDVGSPAASNERGDRLWQYGRVLEAEAAYREALQRLEKLAAVFSDDPTYDQQQVRSLLSMGLLLQAEGKPASEYDQSLSGAREICRGLSPDDQNMLAWSFQERIRNQFDSGNALQAARSRKQGMELANAIAADQAAKRLNDAEVALLKAVKLKQHLAAQTPPNPTLQLDFARSQIELGAIVDQRGSAADAVKSLEAVTDRILEQLAADPVDASLLQEVGHALRQLGDGCVQLKRLKEAERAYVQGSAVFLRLAVDDPTNRHHWQEQLIGYRKLAGLVVSFSHPCDATAFYQRVLELSDQVPSQVRDRAEYRSQLADTCAYLGVALNLGQRPREAEESHLVALALWKALGEEYPDNEWYRQERAHFSLNLTELMRAAGRPEDALEHCRTSTRLNEQLVVDFADKPHHLDRLAHGRAVLITLLSSLHRDEEAQMEIETLLKSKTSGETLNNLAWSLVRETDTSIVLIRMANEMAKKALELAPNAGHVWHTLGVSSYRIGEAKEAIAALQQSQQLRGGGDSFDWFFLAMAHWQLGEKEVAQIVLERAVAWMETNQPQNRDLLAFRKEAEELMNPK